MDLFVKSQTDLRGKAVLMKMWTCLFFGDEKGGPALEQQHDVLTAQKGLGSNVSREDLQKAGAAAEATCGDRLIEETIVGNPRGAGALADFLISRGYHVSPEARAMAKADDNALSMAIPTSNPPLSP